MLMFWPPAVAAVLPRLLREVEMGRVESPRNVSAIPFADLDCAYQEMSMGGLDSADDIDNAIGLELAPFCLVGSLISACASVPREYLHSWLTNMREIYNEPRSLHLLCGGCRTLSYRRWTNGTLCTRRMNDVWRTFFCNIC